MPYDKKRLHDIISILRSVSKAYNASTYIVGGAVRDIMGLRQPKDIDIVASGDIQQVATVLSKRLPGSTAEQVPAPFNLWRVIADSTYIDIVEMKGTIEEDFKKRNFTVNALYYDVLNDTFLDPSGKGFMDLHSSVIRAVSDECFKANSDNIFIALRLVAELNFKVDPRTLRLMVDTVKSEGDALDISNRARKEIKRSQSGLFYQKAQTISRYVGLGDFLSIYKPAEVNDLRTIIAKYKSKKKTEKGNIIYEYSEADKAKRAKKKARHVRTVFKNIGKLEKQFKKDLSSDDMYTRMSALAVALIFHTYERVGDRENIGTGVTSLKKKHVTVSGDTVKLKYVGKSHVKQDKEVHDAKIASLIKELLKDKGDNSYLFDYEGDEKVDIFGKDVNAYLKPFSITAKDLRAHAANDLLIDRLKKAPKPPKGATEAERKKFFKEKLKEAIEDVAEEIGHTPGICKSSYIDPKLIESYEGGGKVTKLADFNPVLFRTASDEIISYLLRSNPNIPQDTLGGEVEAIQSRIESPDVEIDPELSSVAEVMQALEKLRSISPDELRGILKLMPSHKSEVQAPGNAYAFVVSHEPFIVYLDTEKIKSAVNQGRDISDALRHPELVAQIAGVIGHEGEHARGEQGEDKPTRRQEEITRSLLDKASDDTNHVVVGSKDDEDVFDMLGIKIDKENAIPASRAAIQKLRLGSGDRLVINTALLAVGYLIVHGENPYRAEWNVRKALGMRGNISFDAAKDLYEILSRNVGKKVEEPEEKEMAPFADPTDGPADLGDSVSPKWEARPSTWPEEWHSYFPQRHPVNY